MMEPTGFEPVEGKHFTFKTSPAGAWDGVIHCQVLEVLPNQRFAYAWKGGHEANAGYGSPLDTVVTWIAVPRRRTARAFAWSIPASSGRRTTPAFKNMSEGWKKVGQEHRRHRRRAGLIAAASITGGKDMSEALYWRLRLRRDPL